MSESISAFCPISLDNTQNAQTLVNKYLEYAAQDFLNKLDGKYPEGDEEFAEAPLDEYLYEYLDEPDCPHNKKLMLAAMKDYFSEFIQDTDCKDTEIILFVNTQSMDYEPFEYMVKAALTFNEFKTNKLTVFGRTSPSAGSDFTNIWEDHFSKNDLGGLDEKQENHIEN